MVQDHPRGLMCLLRPPFGNNDCMANQIVLCCILKSASRCVALGPLGRGSIVDHVQSWPVTGLLLHGKSYKAVHNCSLPLLYLEVSGRGKAGYHQYLA